MARSVIVYCSNCHKELNKEFGRFSYGRSAYHFGPQLIECPRCHCLYQDRNAIELATKTEEQIKGYCKDYCIDGANLLAIGGCIGLVLFLGMLIGVNRIEQLINTSAVGILILAFCFAFAFAIKVLILRHIFYKKIYAESVERMHNPTYLGKIKAHNAYLEKNAGNED